MSDGQAGEDARNEPARTPYTDSHTSVDPEQIISIDEENSRKPSELVK